MEGVFPSLSVSSLTTPSSTRKRTASRQSWFAAARRASRVVKDFFFSIFCLFCFACLRVMLLQTSSGHGESGENLRVKCCPFSVFSVLGAGCVLLGGPRRFFTFCVSSCLLTHLRFRSLHAQYFKVGVAIQEIISSYTHTPRVRTFIS